MIRVRAFNHLGPGQSERFVAPRWPPASHATSATAATRSPSATSPRRDFTDVRDVVAPTGCWSTGDAGEVYNVCTRRDLSVQELADHLLAGGAERPMHLVTIPALPRVDVPVLVGDASACAQLPAGRRRSRSSRRWQTSSTTQASEQTLATFTGQDGSYLAELLLDKGYEVIGMVRRSSTVNFERIAHLQDRITFVHGDLLDQLSLIDVLGGPPARRGLQPGRPVVRAHQLAAAGAHRRVHRPRRDPDARGDPHRRPGDPLLPGVLQRDVRQGAGDAPERDHAVLPALALRRGQGLRPLDHRQLPRVLRPVRRSAASCSTTSRPAAASSS